MAFERITVNPERMGGKPCIRDLRVTVTMVLGQLAGGRTVEQVLADYPYLEREDVLAALEYAAAGGPTSVNLLVDANLSPAVAAELRDAGHDAVHVIDVGLATALDPEIADYADATTW